MTSILKTDRNCWRIEQTDQLRFIIDGADYFRILRESLKNAKNSLYILSWDIDSRILLVRDDDKDNYPDHLGDLLNFLPRQNPDLHIYMLNWDFAALYTLDREFLPIYKLDWKSHDRVHFRLDAYHPQGASQHQKLVVVDESLAFLGGLDLTKGRWDTSDHTPENSKRDIVDGNISRPYHDVQVMFSGKSAAALAELARDRWHKATGQMLPEMPGNPTDTPWPDTIDPDMEDLDVGIARTQGSYKKQPDIREIKHYYIDTIESARDYIYIENQFFTAPSIGDALQKSLTKEKGPEIVIVMPINTDGWLSQHTMDVLRVRLIRRLKEHDRQNRLQVFYLDAPGLDANPINVHAKLMIVDDRLVTVGSANLNNRSIGLDNECNIVIDAESNESIKKGISRFRNRLMAEHLGCTPEKIDQTIISEKSLAKCIEKLKDKNQRHLKKLPLKVHPDVDSLVPDTEVLDPEHPIRPELMIRHIVPEEEHEPARSRIVTWVILIGIIAALAAMWRWTPLSQWLHVDTLSSFIKNIREIPAAPLFVILGFVLAGFVVFPFSILIIATVIAFGPLLGFIYSLTGGTLSAISCYWVGELLGRRTIRKLVGSRLNTISQSIARHGILNIIFVRVIPVAPFALINLVAGASHIRFRDYIIGTMLGMGPGILAVTLVADRVRVTLQHPQPTNAIVLGVTVALVVAAGTVLVSWLKRKKKKQDTQHKSSS